MASPGNRRAISDFEGFRGNSTISSSCPTAPLEALAPFLFVAYRHPSPSHRSRKGKRAKRTRRYSELVRQVQRLAHASRAPRLSPVTSANSWKSCRSRWRHYTPTRRYLHHRRQAIRLPAIADRQKARYDVQARRRKIDVFDLGLTPGGATGSSGRSERGPPGECHRPCDRGGPET